MDERKLLRELNDHVQRAQRVLAEYLPQESGKSEEETISQLFAFSTVASCTGCRRRPGGSRRSLRHWGLSSPPTSAGAPSTTALLLSLGPGGRSSD